MRGGCLWAPHPEPLSPEDWESLPAPLASGLSEGALVQGRLPQPPSLPSRKMATNFLVHEKIWFDKFKYDDAERKFYEQMNGPAAGSSRQVGAAPPASGRVSPGRRARPIQGLCFQVLVAGSLAGWPWLAPGVLALLLPR